MTSKNNFLLIVTVLCFSLSVFAAEGAEKYLTLKSLGPQKVFRGNNGEVILELEILKEFHIQANPAANDRLIPSTLNLEPEDGLVLHPPHYPPGKPYRLKHSSETISVYSGTLKVKVPVEVSAKAKVGERRLRGKFRFQPCNETICFFPVTASIEAPLKIEDKPLK